MLGIFFIIIIHSYQTLSETFGRCTNKNEKSLITQLIL